MGAMTKWENGEDEKGRKRMQKRNRREKKEERRGRKES